jgi:hypothetical protein
MMPQRSTQQHAILLETNLSVGHHLAASAANRAGSWLARFGGLPGECRIEADPDQIFCTCHHNCATELQRKNKKKTLIQTFSRRREKA